VSNLGLNSRHWTINGRFTAQRQTGVQRYAREIVRAMDQILLEDKEIAGRLRFDLIVPPSSPDDIELSQIGTRRTPLGSGHAWDQCVLPFYRNSGVLSLGNFGPLLVPQHLVCIHDANTFLEPGSYSASFRAAYQTLLPLVGRLAKRVATVSRYSADMLVKYKIATEDKIFIAPNGHEHSLRWNASLATSPVLKLLKRPYVLLLGSRAKHKNIEVILEQAKALDQGGIDIVVVGAAASIFADGGSDITASNVHYPGYVSDDDLAAMYEGALCLAFPSREEGFGLPVLEAMARGCPVVASNAASLVEVGGEAVIRVSPQRGSEWRDAILGLCRLRDLRMSLIEKGQKRVELFSWKRSAGMYLDEIMRLDR
jgi:glycosyltransferase involved in cell wall biosynthesis